MAYDQIFAAGATSKLIEVMVRDSTTGMGKTGLAYGNVTYAYWREGAATGANATCGDMTLGTWASGGWKEVNATNLPGVYQFGIPNAALADGAAAVTIGFEASGMIDKAVRILLSGSTFGPALAATLAIIKGATFDADTDALDILGAKIGLLAGSGSYSVVVTVTDGSDPIENVKVRYTLGADTYYGLTNSSGQVTFGLDDTGTYTVTAAKSGYQFTPTTHAVTGNTTKAIAMTATAIVPSDDPSLSTVRIYTRTAAGVAEAEVDIDWKLVTAPSTSGLYDHDAQEDTTNSSGYVDIELPIGGVYDVKRSTATSYKRFTIADSPTQEGPSV